MKRTRDGLSRLTFYVPSRDRDGEPIDQSKFIEKALRVAALVGGGATAIPGRGAWVDPESNQIMFEDVMVVQTSTNAERFWANHPAIEAFVEDLGRNGRQGEVMFEFEDSVYRYSDFKRRPKLRAVA